MIKCSVLILNWNGKELMKSFLSSVILHTTSDVCEVVVVDNGSTDESIKWLKDNYPQLKTIALDKNYGYTGGYNRAISELDSEYVLLLNSDIEVKQRWCEPLIELMDSDKTIAAAMPKILSQQFPDKFEYAGACGGFIDKYYFPFCRGRIMKNVENDNGQYDVRRDIFWASGAAMIVRRELYEVSGGLDDDFFAHMEEIDICWRLQNMGYRIVVEPKSVVYHVGGATLSYLSPKKLFYNFRNNLFLIHKNSLNKNYKKVIFRRMVIDGLLAMVYLFTFKPKSFMSVIDAHNEYRVNRKKLDLKRSKNIKISTNLNKNKNIYNGSIILRYMMGVKIFSKLRF